MTSLLLAVVLGTSSPIHSQEKSPLKDDNDKVSYCIGMNMGRNMKAKGVPVNPIALAQGMQDAFAGKALMTDEQMQAVMMAFQQKMEAQSQATASAEGEKNARLGMAFLAANKSKDGVKTTASGLQYKVIKSGTGPTPKDTDSVVANYRGTFIDGTEFDSSAKHGGPATFPVTGVIPGWTEALKMMKVGDKWQLFIPPNLAYGANPPGGLPPNATLVFDIELVSLATK